MKKPIQHQNEESMKDYPITNIIEGWCFRVDEISQGYYRVEAVDRWGHSISRDGINADKLLSEIQADILDKFPENNI